MEGWNLAFTEPAMQWKLAGANADEGADEDVHVAAACGVGADEDANAEAIVGANPGTTIKPVPPSLSSPSS